MTFDSAGEFIGRERELNWLKVAWALARRGSPQLCVLRGESGFGKTRIVQAFYSWLSSKKEQDPDGYWPDVLLKEGNNLRLNPPASAFGTTQSIPWLWWGVRWGNPEDHNRGELSSCALIDGLQHLEPHRDALLAARDRRRRAGRAVVELFFELSGTGPAKTIYELVQLWREERIEHATEKISLEERQARALDGQIDALFEFLRFVLDSSSIRAGGLPMILVLDDAHWIDNRSLKLVERLLLAASRHRWPLLLIATHWEQDWNLQSADSSGHTFAALYDRLASEPSQGEYSLTLDLRDIDRLAGLERLLLDALPGLTPEQLDFICKRVDGNPRLLNEVILELHGEPFHFEEEDFAKPLTKHAVDQLAKMSFRLHDVQKRRFRRLDDNLRRLLSYASYQGMRFLRELVLEVAELLDEDTSADASAGRLSSAIQPYAIVAAETAVIYEFRHRVFHDLARERIDRLPQLGDSLRAALLTVGNDWLAKGKVRQLAIGEQESFHLLMLDQFEPTSMADAAQRTQRLRHVAALLLLYRATGHLARALPWLDQLVAVLPSDGRIDLQILSLDDQLRLVDIFLDLSRFRPAELLARGLLATSECEKERSVPGDSTLSARASIQVLLGDVLRAADQPEAARALFEQSLDTCKRILAEFGETAERLRGVGVSLWRIADLDLSEGKDPAALARLIAAEKLFARVADLCGTERSIGELAEVRNLIARLGK